MIWRLFTYWIRIQEIFHNPDIEPAIRIHIQCTSGSESVKQIRIRLDWIREKTNTNPKHRTFSIPKLYDLQSRSKSQSVNTVINSDLQQHWKQKHILFRDIKICIGSISHFILNKKNNSILHCGESECGPIRITVGAVELERRT